MCASRESTGTVAYESAPGDRKRKVRSMRAIWLLMALSLTVATGYLTWFGIAERRAHAPETFVNLVSMLTILCAAGAGMSWGRGLRKRRS